MSGAYASPAAYPVIMRYVQARLQHSHDQFGSRVSVRTCWLREGIKPGDGVTLKNSEDPDILWDVVAVGSESRELDEIPRGWHNNI